MIETSWYQCYSDWALQTPQSNIASLVHVIVQAKLNIILGLNMLIMMCDIAKMRWCNTQIQSAMIKCLIYFRKSEIEQQFTKTLTIMFWSFLTVHTILLSRWNLSWKMFTFLFSSQHWQEILKVLIKWKFEHLQFHYNWANSVRWGELCEMMESSWSAVEQPFW